jgi:hypothetical protein
MIAGRSWSEMPYAVRDDPSLQASEKAWVLGGTARRVLNWPAAGAAG